MYAVCSAISTFLRVGSISGHSVKSTNGGYSSGRRLLVVLVSRRLFFSRWEYTCFSIEQQQQRSKNSCKFGCRYGLFTWKMYENCKPRRKRTHWVLPSNRLWCCLTSCCNNSCNCVCVWTVCSNSCNCVCVKWDQVSYSLSKHGPCCRCTALAQ